MIFYKIYYIIWQTVLQAAFGKAQHKIVISALVEQMPEEQMLVPVGGELDYEKELAEARQEKYGHID